MGVNELHHATRSNSDVLFFAGVGDEAFAAARGAIDNYIRVVGWFWDERRGFGELHVDQ